MNRARYPNSGSDLLVPNLLGGAAQANSVTGAPVKSDDYWAGGTVSGVFNHKWFSQTAKITASSGDTLTLGDKTDPWEQGGGSFYITGIFEELDSAGEWFYVPTEQKMYFWAEGDVNPNTLSVSAKAREWCANLSGREYIILDGIDMLGGSVRMDTNNAQVLNSHMKYISHFTFHTWSSYQNSGGKENGHNGIWIDGNNNLIKGCTIEYSAGSGVIIHGADNLITRNIIRHMDYSGTYSVPLGIVDSQGNNQVLFNSIYNAGRDVVQLYGANNDKIMYNDLYYAGRLCNDLGVTYQWGRNGQGTRIAYNWIHDNLASTGPGVYHDNYCSNFITDHNVIWNVQTGVRHNGPTTGSKTYNNTLFNCTNVGQQTYNQWPDYMPTSWTNDQGGANIYEFENKNNLFLGNDPSSQLTDVSSNNFTLKAGAASIDSGEEILGYTDGFQGSAPDAGAYESGTKQWIPGHNGVSIDGPEIEVQAATNISPISASMNASLSTSGTDAADIYLVWGDEDAGQDASAWDNTVALGNVATNTASSFSENVSNLTEQTTYFYRFYASSDQGTSWTSAESFIAVVPGAIGELTFSIHQDVFVNPDGSRETANTSLIAGNAASSGTYDRRIFFKFDLSTLETDREILSAKVRLYYIETDVTSQIQAYQTDAESHKGFSIRGTEGFTQTAKYFVSSEGSEGQRPELVVSYFIEDTDSDGLKDSWEWEYFQDLDSADETTDNDGDNTLDIDEQTAGTSPIDVTSRFELLTPTVTESEGVQYMNISWESADGRTYQIEKSRTLGSNDWVSEASNISATPPQNTHAVPMAVEEDRYFYRITVEN